MAKFVYTMQNILNIKQKLENQAKIAYGQANAKLLEEQRKLQEILVRKARYEERARELVSGSIHIREIRENKQAIDAMKSAMRAQLLQVQSAERAVEDARRKLNDVMVERKTHEKLREKQFEQFKEELAYEENKVVDGLVSYTYQKGTQE
ncbi:MAG: flagellar export protein FliJ [Lachnospiraceae bacterium]|nr:flagellar export protein FliJ [Lachnospiraceae bacterium]